MADFSAELQSFRSSSFPFMESDNLNLESVSVNQFAGLNGNSPTVLDTSNFVNFQTFLPFSTEPTLFGHLQPPHEFPPTFPENCLGIFPDANQNAVLPVAVLSQPCVITHDDRRQHHELKKRKSTEIVSESSSGTGISSVPSPSPVSVSGSKRKQSSGRGKRVKSSATEDEKPKEVVHVRARRGQATDSHSLAERVRRGKINDRLRCLQDIVPGCYKTMGMAMMLDEIINYVQSLQNQVEFLSMKLTAASTFYDFNSESEAIETMQRAKAQEYREIERLMKEAGFNGGNLASSSWHL